MAVKKRRSSSAAPESKKSRNSRIPEVASPSQSMGEQSSGSSRHIEKKKLATGCLLTLYRRLREVSRDDLAGASGISVSLLGMIENGARLPSQEVLERLAKNLHLSAYEHLQLHALAGYSAQLSEARSWEVGPDDLIQGVPLFLRNMQLESNFQLTVDFEEAWIIAARPLALNEPVLNMLKRKLLETNATYTYFVDARFGENDFATLWSRLDLASDPIWKEKRRNKKKGREPLAFVLSPPALCASTHSLALFNPRSETRSRFGRAVYYSDGRPIGVYPLDLVLFDQLVSLLTEAYVDCEKHPEQPFPKDPSLGGTFRLLKPPE